MAPPGRADPGGVERLVRVDVSDPSDQRLVEKRGLHGTGPVTERIDGRLPRIERIGPELAVPSLQERTDVRVRNEATEPARIPEHHRASVARREHPLDVTVRTRPVRRHEHLTRHSELNDERPTVVDDDRELLPAPHERRDGAADEQFAARHPRATTDGI